MTEWFHCLDRAYEGFKTNVEQEGYANDHRPWFDEIRYAKPHGGTHLKWRLYTPNG